MIRIALLLGCLLGAVPAAAQADMAASDAEARLGELAIQRGQIEREYRARVDSLITMIAERSAPDLSRGHYAEIMANLHRGTNLEWAVARLDTLMAAPRGDMFWMFPFMATMQAGRDVLPEATQAKMRDLWRTYEPYRGDTENHWALYYATLYLAAQMYPDEPGEMWFTGKSSQENFDEAEEWLHHWMDLTTTARAGRVRFACLPQRLPHPDGAPLRVGGGPGDAPARRDDARLHHRRLGRRAARRPLRWRAFARLRAWRHCAGPDDRHPVRIASVRARTCTPESGGHDSGDERLRAAYDPPCDRHRPRGTLHPPRAKAHPPPLPV